MTLLQIGQRVLGDRWPQVYAPFSSAFEVLHSPNESSNPALESRVLVGYVVALSALFLGLQYICRSDALKRLRAQVFGPEQVALNINYVPEGNYVARHGGATILTFQATRFAANVVLTVIAVLKIVSSGGRNSATAAIAFAAAYATLLSAVLLAKPVSQSRRFSVHASLVGLSIFICYFYRDVWPYFTFVLSPADNFDPLAWAIFTLSCISSLIIPLCEPYPYIPFDPSCPQPVPSPEQTSPLIFFVFYAFLDPVIVQSYRVDHLSFDMLPPAVDTDALSALKLKTYPYLDPFYGSKDGKPRRVHVLFGLLASFRGSWGLQAMLLILASMTLLGSPIGTNRLLAYLEARGSGQESFIRPWVWIGWIALFPFMQVFLRQLYEYLMMRSYVHIEAVLTGLVYDHALRVRIIHKPDEATKNTSDPLPATEPAKPVSTAVGGSDGTVTATSAAANTHPRVESRASTATAVTSTPSSPKAKGKDIKADEGNKEQKKASQDFVGRLNNLVTSDLVNITEAGDFLCPLVEVPVSVALDSWFLYSILGPAAWVGLAVMVALMPVPAWVGKSLNGTQKRKMQATDKRVKRVKDILGVLRMVKQFGWEEEVKKTIGDAREEELRWIFWSKMLNLVNICVNFIVPLMHMVVSLTYFTLVQKRPLTASIVFSALMGFTMLRLALFALVNALPALILAKVSIARVQEFLNDTELLDRYTPGADVSDVSVSHPDELGLSNATFTWYSETPTSGSITPGRGPYRLRIDEPLVFYRGGFNLIIGPTGCGKTSLLMALLGEMHYIPSGPSSWVNVPREGGLAYCAQESWVQSLSIRDNILFGKELDEARYQKVLYQCGLKRDLSLLDAGDLTEVGERGLTLSGGQKARVSLARAVYSNAETLFLDDILAALDVHTSVWIVNKCLKGDLVRGRTVLLVTHNVTLTAPIADFVVSLGADGRILASGSPSETVLKDRALAEQVAHEQAALELEEELEEENGDDTKKGAEGAKLVVAEEIHRGHVSWKAMTLFLGTLSGWPIVFWAAYLGGQCMCQAAQVFEMWWLGHWANAYEHEGQVNVVYYLSVYVGIFLFILLAYCWCTGLFTFATVRSGRIVHNRLMNSLLSSTFRWLDTTPTSRIIARCTQDIQSVDGSMGHVTNVVLLLIVSCLSRLVAIIFSAPIFIVPGLLIGIVGGIMGQLYIKAQVSVKREQSNAKSPVLAEVNGAFDGLASIRAFGAQDMFTRQSIAKINKYSHVSVLLYNLNKWISVRIQILSNVFAGGLAFYLVYGPGSASRTASTVGFSLNMAVGFSGAILQIVRWLNELEVQANSLERIQSYIDIEKEPEPKEGGVPPAYWPSSGDLRVQDLVARYSPGGPIVLDNISFHIKSGERVGVVGRTGSGKSTLTLSLLRCIFTDGEVYYDGILTSSLNLDALRANITIIPQAPELLSGTLRKNLDMFGRHDDAELNAGLRSAGLFTLQSEADENRLTLDTQIAAGGGNLSVGQRQIIALARAILRQSKLLILDEATSAIDYETDAVIQSSLRTELKSDVTVITVAHRLQTVLDSDKIMVLDAGKLVEFDTPRNLLEKEESFLRALVDESADKDELYALAEGKARARV